MTSAVRTYLALTRARPGGTPTPALRGYGPYSRLLSPGPAINRRRLPLTQATETAGSEAPASQPGAAKLRAARPSGLA